MDAADFYTGLVAEVYAHLRPATFDPKPYEDFVRSRGEPALEVGCGHGQPLLELCAAGLDVDGVDSSADMVESCCRNARDRGIETSIWHQRVEALDVPRRYGSIYFAGPTFNLLPDDDTAQRALQRVAHHLVPGGGVLIPLWVPPPTPQDGLGVAEVDHASDGVDVRFTPIAETYDVGARTRTTTCRYERLDAQQTEVAERDWVLHWFTPTQFAELAGRAGLTVDVIIDTESGRRADDTSTEFAAILTKPA